MQIIVVVISLMISAAFSWQVSKFIVNLAISSFEFLILLLVINAIAGYLVHSLDMFSIWGLIIGAIMGSAFGIISEMLRIDSQ